MAAPVTATATGRSCRGKPAALRLLGLPHPHACAWEAWQCGAWRHRHAKERRSSSGCSQCLGVSGCRGAPCAAARGSCPCCSCYGGYRLQLLHHAEAAHGSCQLVERSSASSAACTAAGCTARGCPRQAPHAREAHPR